MAQRKLLTNGSAFVRTDGRWAGVVWFMDERGERKRKSFSGTTKAEVNKKMVDYVAAFDKMIVESDESKKTLETSMTNWLKVFKFPSIERGSKSCAAVNKEKPKASQRIPKRSSAVMLY